MKKQKVSENIIKHDFKITRKDREKLNAQNSVLLWFTGLSGSGKSTLANEVEIALYQLNFRTYLLDGDNTRQGINSDLDFSEESRVENIRRVGEIANLFLDAGIITLASFISPFESDREKVKNLVGAENYIEIYVNCSVDECERRDVKGLYAKARAGEIENFTGISSPYEVPKNPNIIVNSQLETLEGSTLKVLEYLKEKEIIR